MLMENNANAANAIMIDVKKLIAQLQNATVVVQKLPSVKGHLRLVTLVQANKENENNNQCDDDDEFFFKEPGKKRASRVSKPFCSTCNVTVENHRAKDKYCLICKTLLLFKCMTCRTQYTSYRGIQLHLKTKCDETMLYIQCSICDYATHSKQALAKHLKYVHQNIQEEYFEELYPAKKSINCENCGKTFKYRCNLTQHLKACKTRQSGCLPDNEDTLKSSENKMISNKTNVNANVLGYSVKYQIKSKTQSMIKYRCLKCNKTKKGISVHHSPKCRRCNSLLSFTCKKCSKQYQSYDSMKYHLESKCSPAALYQCSKCSYKTTVKDLIRRHIRNRHISADTKSCLERSKCGVQKKNSMSLTNNFQFRKVNDLQCSKCGAEKKNSMSLASHFKFCGIKPNLFCKFCSYKSKFKQNLKKHLLNHSGVDKNNVKDVLKELCTKKITEKPREEISDRENKKPDSVDDKSNMLKACCPKCNEEIEISENVDKKCRNCEATIFFKCKKCNKPISNYYNAKSHVRSCFRINIANIMPCKYCKKKIDNYAQFKRHLKYCESKVLYRCQNCGYRGSSHSDINVHKKRCNRIRSTGKTKTIKPIGNVQEAKSNVKDEIITSKAKTVEVIQEAQDDSNGIIFSINGINIIRKRIAEHIPKINEMASRHCPKCKRVYEGSNNVRSFCEYCNKIELHHQCRKCEKQYKHVTSLLYHLQSHCFPTTLFTCTICNYSNNIRSEILKHAKNIKHAVARI